MNYCDFRKSLAEMDYLDVTAAEYARVFADVLAEQSETEAGKARTGAEVTDPLNLAVPFLATVLLLQYSFSRQNLCVFADGNSLAEIVAQMRENCIMRNFSCKRFCKTEDPDKARKEACKEFDGFWRGALGEDYATKGIDLDPALLPDGFAARLDDELIRKLETLAAPGDFWHNALGLRYRKTPQAPVSAPDGGPENGKSLPPETAFIIYRNALYYARQFTHESAIVEYIRARGRIGAGRVLEHERSVNEKKPLARISEYLNILFDRGDEKLSSGCDLQKATAAASCLSDFSIITGGPGTGKTTTVVKLLLLLICLFGPGTLNIRMAAPTGKAANRMKESVLSSLDGFRNEKTQAGRILMNLAVMSDQSAGSILDAVPAEADTIHRLLGRKFEGPARYNAENPLPYDVVIVDEASMMDAGLFYDLLSALKPDAKLILLGDRHQLPSVEAGSVFGDLCGAFLKGLSKDGEAGKLLRNFFSEEELSSERANISGNAVRLAVSHRFDGKKAIGLLAAYVNGQREESDGENRVKLEDIMKNLDIKSDKLKETLPWMLAGDSQARFREEDKNVFAIDVCAPSEQSGPNASSWLKDLLVGCNGYDDLHHAVMKLDDGNTDLSLPENLNKAAELFATFDRFRVLCTNRETRMGVHAVNRIFCSHFRSLIAHSSRPDRVRSSAGGFSWYPGLPVMITSNNYSLELFNGDIGITMKNPLEQGSYELVVLFRMSDGTFRYYPVSVLPDYEAAYAMTIHKSQGSEADHVLLLTQENDSRFITREILYTGITRARYSVTLVYNSEFFEEQINRSIMRCSNLENRVEELLERKTGDV